MRPPTVFPHGTGFAVARARALLLGCMLVPLPLVAGPPAGDLRSDSSAVVDSARAEMEVGRHWHAALLLQPLWREGRLDREGTLLLARAEAGYRNWEGARSILEGLPWLDEAGRDVWGMLGRAREGRGDHAGAAEAYARALPPDAPLGPLHLRRVRVLWRAGERDAALAALEALPAGTPRSWLAFELLQERVEAGDTARVRRLLASTDTRDVLDRAWEALPRARWVAGDTVGAARDYGTVLAIEGVEDRRRAPAWGVLGEASLAAGDTMRAVDAFARSLDASATGRWAAVAAARLVDVADLDADGALAAARVLDRAGDGRRALRAYDRHVEASETAGREPSAAARVERARLMATVPERQEEAIGEYRLLATHPDPDVGARTLELWAGLRGRQGRTNDQATIRRWLVERYPDTRAASEIVFFLGDDAHDRLDLDRALEEYDRVIAMAPAQDLGGLARMRSGQILLHRGETARAAAVFEAYLEAFPAGRRWEEASYWAARAHLALGDTARGVELLERLQGEQPFSYYAVLTADLFGRPFDASHLPAGPADPPPAWLEDGLAELGLLKAADLHAGVDHLIEELAARARSEGPGALLALAESLNERGHPMAGINLGWEVRRAGEPWSLRLLQVVYPFPYREMVLREAAEWGLDPFLMAALIRQESAWVPDIVSSAGAIGLMQVMPATGRGLARAVGPENFTVESLETPEVNLHLGARFLVDVLERYGPDLPLVLSAYNAGPSRAERWKGFPEAADPLRLTERIPFGETRGYVKNVTRNARLYEALYRVAR